MIIQCDQCQKRFKIADEKVSERGVKVKCKNCGNIFVVKRPEEVSSEGVFEDIRIDEDLFPSEMTTPKEEDRPGDLTVEGMGELSWEGGLTSEEPSKMTEETPLKGEGIEEEEKAAASVDEGEEFQFAFESSTEEAGQEIEGNVTPVFEQEAEDTKIESKEEVEEGSEEPVVGGEEEAVSEPEPFDAEGIFEEDTVIPSFEEKKGLSLTKILVLILAILVIAVAGLSITGNIQVGFVDTISNAVKGGISKVLKGIGVWSREEPSIGLIGLKGHYQSNEKVGLLYVVEGRIVNPADTPKPIKGLRSVVFDKDGRPLQERNVSPGRIIPLSQLRGLSRDEIERDLKGSIDTLPAGRSVPFMVVFYKVPTDLSEFMVEVQE